MLPIKRLTAPRTVYIANGLGDRLDLAIPVRGGISLNEQNLVEKVIKEKGTGTLNPLMKSIAQKIAENNGGDPIKVLTLLVKYSRGDRFPDPLADYRSYAMMYCQDEFDQYSAAVEDGKLAQQELAGCLHALLTRVEPTQEFDPKKWKTEMALNSDELPFSLLQQAGNLYYLEAQGRDISQYVNADNEFTWVPAKVKDDAPVEKETAEAIAGKS